MKTQTPPYIDREEAVEQNAVELFHFWNEVEDWFYTSHDEAFNYQSETYQPASLTRGSVSYDSKLEVSTINVSAAFNEDPLIDFIAQNPIEPIWLEILRVHKDRPAEASVVFIGQAKMVGISGQEATLQGVGFEFFLKQRIPILRFQPKCNYFIYDDLVDGSGCGVDQTGFKLSTTVDTITSDGLTITNSDFALEADGFYKYGWIEFQNERRMITSHVGSTIEIRYRIFDLEAGSSIDAYPGCDGAVETCRDKFSNVDQFGGFPYIPVDNPATRF